MKFKIIKGGNSEAKSEGYFEMRIRGVSSEYEAFSSMIAAMSYEKIPWGSIEVRGFKRTLRPADLPLEIFINRKLKASNPYIPVWCLKSDDGWIFFGSV